MRSDRLTQAESDVDDWLIGGGEMGKLVRSFDWSATPLGPRDNWPQSLRTAASMVLSSRFPMAIRWGADQIMIYNEGYCLLAGSHHPGILGQPSRQAWPEIWEFNKTIVERVITRGESVHLEDQLVRLTRNGHTQDVYLTVCYSPIHVENGAIGGTLVTIVETTGRVVSERQQRETVDKLRNEVADRTQAEDALRLNEEQLRAAATAAEIGMWSWTPGTSHVVVNANWRRLFGVSDDAHVTFETWRDTLHPADRGQAVAELNAASDQHREFNVEYRVIRPDGTTRWIIDRGRAWYDERGRPRGMAGVNVDITDRKLAENALRESEKILRESQTIAGLGSYVLDIPSGTWKSSKVLDGLFGIDQAYHRSVEGWAALIHPADREMMADYFLYKVIGQGHAFDKEYRIIRLDNRAERWVHGSGRLELDPQGHPQTMYGTIQDITDHKLAEEQLADAKAAAETANKAKDHFLATLSHELRTPLTPVLLTISLLANRADLPDAVRADLHTVRQNVELEARIIDDLLDLTRISRGKLSFDFQTVDLHPLIRRAAEISGQGPGATIALNLSATDHHLLGDPARLQQVFWNLLNNARKFTPPDGTITVRSSSSPACITIEVIDTGIGIEPHFLPRIFDAFEQGDPAKARQTGGLGLGLAISKAIMDAHHSTIAVASEGKGHGTTFILEFPPTTAPLLPFPETSPPTTPPLRPLRILLVEDHPSTLKVMANLLASFGHQVHTATTLAAAMQETTRTDFDLLISDLGLPDGNGHQLMRHLKQRGNTKGIALSGYGMDDDIRQSKEAGFDEHLTKPLDVQKLQSTITRIMRP